MPLAEALRYQIEVQRKLHEQLEVPLLFLLGHIFLVLAFEEKKPEVAYLSRFKRSYR